MPRDSVRDVTRTRDRASVVDERLVAVKRRVQLLAKLDGEPVFVAEGLHVVRIKKVRNARALVEALRARGVIDRATLDRTVTLAAPPVAIDSALLAAAQRELRALSAKPVLAIARESRRALARYGRIDEAWLDDKRLRIERLTATSTSSRSREAWFEGVLEIVRAIEGDAATSAIAHAHRRVLARAPERRKEARERVDAIAASVESGEPPEDGELAELAERLEAARELPGRARRRRVLAILRQAVGWPDAPAEMVTSLASPKGGEEIVDHFRDAGRAMALALPASRDPELRERTLDLLAMFALAFRVEDGPVVVPAAESAPKILAKIDEGLALASSGITFARAIALVDLPMKRAIRAALAHRVAEGLEIELVADACEKGIAEEVASVSDVRAARAYATWATRLSSHYEALGMKFKLSPELFANLPRNEDLAVLGMCLMEHARDPKAGTGDPVAVLDATLGLFQKLPTKAKGILGRLRGIVSGEGRRLFPDVAEWLDDDALLDRYVHVLRLAGQPVALSNRIREDFEHAARTAGELAHLEKLERRSIPQEGRLVALRKKERTLTESPKGRTRRRIQDRIDALLPTAYRSELDATFREILREAWGIAVPQMTAAWRDAVRFWLVVDDNRELLGQLLREAAERPGADVKLAFAKNRAWLHAAGKHIDVDAWVAPRRETLQVESARFTISLEEDPLEVLRMGIPFGTCLALETGTNAPSTVINAIDVNKRVLYVRGESGKVVARKLLGITEDRRLAGYHLYLSVAGAEEIAIREGVLRFCTTLAREVGTPLTADGKTPQIHDGFWYDDGVEPFEQDVGITAYCEALGVAPPSRWLDMLAAEARGWAAMQAHDVDEAIGALRRWDRSPSTRRLGRWVIDAIGTRAAEQRARTDERLAYALFDMLRDMDEAGALRAFELAPQFSEAVSARMLRHIVDSFPPSARMASALVELAERALKRFPAVTEYGLAHVAIERLPAMLEGAFDAFDALDRAEEIWAEILAVHPHCKVCLDEMVERAAEAVLHGYERFPDDDAVLACLMSRRRSPLAQRVALRIAARHELGDQGERAMSRFCALHPELAKTPDGIAAVVRQSRTTSSAAAIARKILPPSAPPFEALADLVLTRDDLQSVLGEPGAIDLETYAPGPWELAWYRRHPSAQQTAFLFDAACREPHRMSRALELLGLLGEVDRVEAVRRLAEETLPAAYSARGPSAKMHPDADACLTTAVALRDQVRLAAEGRLDPRVAVVHQDAGYVDLARRVIVGEASLTDCDDPIGLARLVLFAIPGIPIDWPKTALLAAERGDTVTATRILDERLPGTPRPPDVVVSLWKTEAIRPSIARAFGRDDETWGARAAAVVRAPGGSACEDLAELTALAIAPKAFAGFDTLDGLRASSRRIAAEAAPADAVRFYIELPDSLSAATFLQAVRRLPFDRAAALREAVSKLDFEGHFEQAKKEWLIATRSLRKGKASSIER